MNHFRVDDDLDKEGNLMRQSQYMALEIQSDQIRVSQVDATDGR